MKRLVFLPFALLILASCRTHVALPGSDFEVSDGRLYRLEIFSPELNETIETDIWTPQNYTAWRRYKVLYAHDGQNLFDAKKTWNGQSWNLDSTTQTLVNQGVIESIIIVGIHSHDRTRTGDLTTRSLIRCMTDSVSRAEFDAMTEGQYRGEEYLKFIVETLKPEVDRLFSTQPNRDGTFIMGSSSGAIISMSALAEYSSIFGGAACLSMHVNNPGEQGGMLRTWLDYLPQTLHLDAAHRLYIDCGDQTLDAAYHPYFGQLSDWLKQNCDAQLSSKIFENHAHDERSWQLRASEPLQFLFGKK